MRLAVLELNDQALLIKNQDGEMFSEPGFALHTSDGIVTGIEARKQAWLQPQNVYRQYWRNLNQTELSADLPWARHHADIAFAQLKTLLNSAGAPEQLIISVAACFDDEQLSLLLGLLSAIPVEVIGVVDSSLADCMFIANHVHGPKRRSKNHIAYRPAPVSICRQPNNLSPRQCSDYRTASAARTWRHGYLLPVSETHSRQVSEEFSL